MDNDRVVIRVLTGLEDGLEAMNLAYVTGRRFQKRYRSPDLAKLCDHDCHEIQGGPCTSLATLTTQHRRCDLALSSLQGYPHRLALRLAAASTVEVVVWLGLQVGGDVWLGLQVGGEVAGLSARVRWRFDLPDSGTWVAFS